MNGAGTIVLTELRAAWRNPAAFITGVLFFFLVILLAPFTLGPEPEILTRIAPGMVWLAVIFAGLMGLERLLAEDGADGTADLLALSPLPLPWLLTLKFLAHWLVAGLPLLALMPLAAVLLHISFALLPLLMLSAALGALLLTLLGGCAVALTLGLPRGIALVALLLVPLMIPGVIFGVATLDAAQTGGNFVTPLFLLAAMTVAALVAAPWAAAAALRHSLE